MPTPIPFTPGDLEAAARRLAPRIPACLRGRLDADDLVAAAALRVAAGRGRHAGDPVAVLVYLARAELVDECRRRRSRRRSAEVPWPTRHFEPVDRPGREPGPLAVLVAAELVEQLRARVPPERRWVLDAVLAGGTAEDVAWSSGRGLRTAQRWIREITELAARLGR